MSEPQKFPFYIRVSVILTGFFVFFSMLYIAQDIILPIVFAAIFAVLVSPMVDFLVKKKLNRVLSIAIVLVIVLLMVASFIWLLSSQLSTLSSSWPQLIEKCEGLFHNIVSFVARYFSISEQTISNLVNSAIDNKINISNAAIGDTLYSFGGILAAAFLIPVYMFMFLYYQSHILTFVHKLFSARNNHNVSEVLDETKTIIQRYLIGLFVEFGIIAVLNSAGLLMLGIEYAILLGILGALLNVIPFIGGIIAIGLFVIAGLLTKPAIYALYVIILYSAIQFIDNNYIIPKIIGSKVKLNALVCIIAVIIGNLLWGIPGMFLSIPLTAVIKLICDHINSLKPWGFLLGDESATNTKMKFNFTTKRFISNFTLTKS